LFRAEPPTGQSPAGRKIPAGCRNPNDDEIESIEKKRGKEEKDTEGQEKQTVKKVGHPAFYFVFANR
jgi:hypothetical protein